MDISWERIAGWVTLLGLGFALGIGFIALRQGSQPAPVEIIPPPPTATPSPTATLSLIRVYVTGAVRTAAVYELEPGGIIDDAVRAAGGFSPDADPVAINLAQPVYDGMQIYVPSRIEAVATPPVVSGSGGNTGGDIGGVPSRLGPGLFAGLVDINRATAAELEALPGIGPSLAAQIIAYREANGPFASVELLLDVPGIGDAKLAAIRELVTVGP
jgi:competence protein ComEA